VPIGSAVQIDQDINVEAILLTFLTFSSSAAPLIPV